MCGVGVKWVSVERGSQNNHGSIDGCARLVLVDVAGLKLIRAGKGV